jgi:hypothetical protein
VAYVTDAPYAPAPAASSRAPSPSTTPAASPSDAAFERTPSAFFSSFPSCCSRKTRLFRSASAR